MGHFKGHIFQFISLLQLNWYHALSYFFHVYYSHWNKLCEVYFHIFNCQIWPSFEESFFNCRAPGQFYLDKRNALYKFVTSRFIFVVSKMLHIVFFVYYYYSFYFGVVKSSGISRKPVPWFMCPDMVIFWFFAMSMISCMSSNVN